jgi:hypothetical protein
LVLMPFLLILAVAGFIALRGMSQNFEGTMRYFNTNYSEFNEFNEFIKFKRIKFFILK